MKKIFLATFLTAVLSCKSDKKENMKQAIEKPEIPIVKDSTSVKKDTIIVSEIDNNIEFSFTKPFIKKFVAGNPELFPVKDTANLKYLYSYADKYRASNAIVEIGYQTDQKFDTIRSIQIDAEKGNIYTYSDGNVFYWPKKGMTIEKGVKALSLLTNEVKNKLKKATPSEANNLYRHFTQVADSIVFHIEMYEEEFLVNYYNFYSYDENAKEGEKWTLNLPKEGQRKKELLNKNNIEIWDVGEGIHNLRLYYDTAQKLFSGRVTPDYQEYIDLTTAENKTLYQADAALVIEFSELRNRIASWENFMVKYPESDLLESKNEEHTVFSVKEHYKMLQEHYLFGMDNTPTMEYNNCKVYDENKKEFQRFKDSLPNSYTNKLIAIILNNKDTIYENLHKKVIALREQNPLLKK